MKIEVNDTITLKTFREGDWDGLAGAECFENGLEPLICEVSVKAGYRGNRWFQIVVDKNGIEITYVPNDEYDENFTYRKDTKNLEDSLCFLENVNVTNPSILAATMILCNHEEPY
jgi:hypothetical protein